MDDAAEPWFMRATFTHAAMAVMVLSFIIGLGALARGDPTGVLIPVFSAVVLGLMALGEWAVSEFRRWW